MHDEVSKSSGIHNGHETPPHKSGSTYHGHSTVRVPHSLFDVAGIGKVLLDGGVSDDVWGSGVGVVYLGPTDRSLV